MEDTFKCSACGGEVKRGLFNWLEHQFETCQAHYYEEVDTPLYSFKVRRMPPVYPAPPNICQGENYVAVREIETMYNALVAVIENGPELKVGIVIGQVVANMKAIIDNKK